MLIERYLGLNYLLTEDPHLHHPESTVSINYSLEAKEGFFNIYQDPLLIQEDIKQQDIIVSREKSSSVTSPEIGFFFKTNGVYDLPFDLFSAAFYLLTRYEEYLPHEKDAHGRYKSSNSILSNKAFNFLPIVEIWMDDFKKRLKKLHPQLLFKEPTFQYIPTIDIDNAFKYMGRNWLKKPPNILNKQCCSVLMGRAEDPYNTVLSMIDQLEKFGQEPILFFLLSDQHQHDSNVQPTSKKLQALIQSLQKNKLGIHPSYLATKNNKIQQQKQQLEYLYPEITQSRQHFLRINFPDYFNQLIEAGIKIDYSLAYPDVQGFRAGYSKPFPFYDLEKNCPTSLILQPSCWMDATYEYYNHLSEQEVKEEFSLFFSQLKKINANLVTIFHNDLFATNKHRSIFNYIHQKINSQ